MFLQLKALARKVWDNLRELNQKQKEQAAKGFHSVSIGAGLTVGLNLITDGKTNTSLDNWITFVAILCAIIFQLLAILVLTDSGQRGGDL